MPRRNLTEEGVKRLQPPAKGKQKDYFDGVQPGLVLRVNYGGAKIWRALHYVKRIAADGKRVTMPTTFKLGRYPTLSVKQAREKARQFLADPQKGLTQAEVGSFKEVAENWITRYVEPNKLRSAPQLKRMLARYVYPQWQHRPFLEIRRREVNDLLDYLADKHGTAQADAVLAVIRSVMAWHQTRDDNYTSPVVRGMKRNRNGKARDRILSHDEVRMLWKACDEQGRFGAMLKLLLLTAQRREKVATTRWQDVVDGVWTIASEAREKGNAGVLKLPQLALDIIAAQPRIAGNPYVFGYRRGKWFTGWSHYKAQLDAKLKDMPHWTVHDLRRTARSLLAEIGVADNIAEQVLGHAIRGVHGIYNRHAYFEEKADALLRLARLVESIVNPPSGNVVPAAGRFKRGAGKKRARATRLGSERSEPKQQSAGAASLR
jgi:integrase